MANAKPIHFDSCGVKCAADLYLPDAGTYAYPRPGVVMGHGLSIIKSALVQQATYLANAGYVVMAIDYRTFGESEGEPRAQIWPLDQVEDFRNAITWLEQRTELVIPDRIGIWGVSFGGGVVLYTAAIEPRVKVVVITRLGAEGCLCTGVGGHAATEDVYARRHYRPVSAGALYHRRALHWHCRGRPQLCGGLHA